jgi:hypothetical protein
MIKKFTLLLLAMLCVAGINARVFETQLWSGSNEAESTDVVEISASNLSGLKAGDAIRVYITNTSGASYAIWYGTDKTTTPRAGLSAHSDGWGWVSSGKAYEDVTLSAADVTNLDGKKIFIQIGNTSGTVLTKVAHFGEVTPSSVSDNLLDDSWASSKETPKIFSAINSVKMGDVLRFTVSTGTTAWTWVQFKLTDKDGTVGQFTGEGSEPQGNNANTSFTLEFTISTLNDLWKIMNSGFGVIQTSNDAFTLTAVNLLSYDDSHDYTIDIEMNSDGYMTYSNSVNLDFSGTGLTPYYASSAKEGTVTLTSATTTWNWQGYILRGPAGPHHPKVVADAKASYPTGNLLKPNIAEGTVKASESGDTNFRYILAKKKEEPADIGFYKLTSDHTLAANKAYLETNSDLTPTDSGNAPALKLIFGGGGEGTTAINTVSKNPVVEDGVYYNLQGVAVKNPSKGLYILNGKKVIVK